MTSRILLNGILAAPAVRRTRRADGVVFAIATVNDSDRGERRVWTLFANAPDVIQQLEELRVGEPIAIAGSFAVSIIGSERVPRLEYRVTVEALVDTKRRKKAKGAKRAEERVESDALAPSDGGPNDDLPF